MDRIDKIQKLKFSNFQRTLLLILVAVFSLFSCADQTEELSAQRLSENDIEAEDAKTDRELATDFLTKLKSVEVDTVLFYQRTCVGCCDFFNVFWTKNGEHGLHKFYFDFNDMKTHSVAVKLSNDHIFSTIFENQDELSRFSIKENIHKKTDGTTITSIIDHFCYTDIKIYLNHDSIFSGQILDHSFDQFTGFSKDQVEGSLTNDNYPENKNSKWNQLLICIENELVSMGETPEREMEILGRRR